VNSLKRHRLQDQKKEKREKYQVVRVHEDLFWIKVRKDELHREVRISHQEGSTLDHCMNFIVSKVSAIMFKTHTEKRELGI